MFVNKLAKAIETSKRCLNVEFNQPSLPPNRVQYTEEVVRENPNCAAYKFNMSSFLDIDGMNEFHSCLQLVPENSASILDAKFNDIQKSMIRYANAVYSYGVDAVTVNTTFGYESIQPFLNNNIGVFVIVHGSNPGSSGTDYKRALEIAAKLRRMSPEVGLVVGATHPAIVKAARKRIPDAPILLPEIGTQGADLFKLLEIKGPLLFSSSW